MVLKSERETTGLLCSRWSEDRRFKTVGSRLLQRFLLYVFFNNCTQTDISLVHGVEYYNRKQERQKLKTISNRTNDN